MDVYAGEGYPGAGPEEIFLLTVDQGEARQAIRARGRLLRRIVSGRTAELRVSWPWLITMPGGDHQREGRESHCYTHPDPDCDFWTPGHASSGDPIHGVVTNRRYFSRFLVGRLKRGCINLTDVSLHFGLVAQSDFDARALTHSPLLDLHLCLLGLLSAGKRALRILPRLSPVRKAVCVQDPRFA